jgi:hypothetical protein
MLFCSFHGNRVEYLYSVNPLAGIPGRGCMQRKMLSLARLQREEVMEGKTWGFPETFLLFDAQVHNGRSCGISTHLA